MYVLALTGFLFVLCVPHPALAALRHPGTPLSFRLRAVFDRSAVRRDCRWMKREAVSETRRRVTRHLREIDAPVDENNWFALSGTSVGQY